MGVAIKKSMNGKMGKLYVEWEKRLAHMVLLMEEILHQLVGSLSVYPIIYQGFYIPGEYGKDWRWL